MVAGSPDPTVSPDEVVSRFAALFTGRDDAYGLFDSTRADYRVVRGPLTRLRYQEHLQGRCALGVFPVRGEHLARWLVVDLDRPDATAAWALVDTLAVWGLPAYVERSKSKGYHVWVLFDDWYEAEALRLLGLKALEAVGLPRTTEVFPKQGHLGPGRLGNFVNLPYQGALARHGRQVMVDRQDQPIPLARFLDTVTLASLPSGLVAAWQADAADARVRDTGTAEIEVVAWGDRRLPGYDGPDPACVQFVLAHDLSEFARPGEPLYRNEALCRLAAYHLSFRKDDADHALAVCLAWNDRQREPLSEHEVRETVRKMAQGGYRYGCRRIRGHAAFRAGCVGAACPFYREAPDDTLLPVLQTLDTAPPAPVLTGAGDGDGGLSEPEVAELLAVGWLRDYVDTVRRLNASPRLMHAAGGLAVLAACAGNRYTITAWSSVPTCLNLYLALLAPSARSYKTTALGHVRNLMEAANPGGVLPPSFTPQSLTHWLTERRAEGLLVIDELGMTMADWAQSKLMAEMKTLLTKLYGNEALHKYLKGQSGKGEVEYAARPALTILGATTVHGLRGAITVTDLYKGLPSRILWLYTSVNEPEPQFPRRFSADDWRPLLAHPMILAQSGSVDRPIWVDTEPVEAAFHAWQQDWRLRQRDVNPALESVINRAPVYVRKVMALLALADDKPGDPSPRVAPGHLERATAVVEWCVGHQQWLLDEVFLFSDFDEKRSLLMEHLKAAGGRLTRTDLLRRSRMSHRHYTETLLTMREGGWVRVVTAREHTGRGRPAQWVCLPTEVRPGEVDVA